jgi:hypothetical protein
LGNAIAVINPFPPAEWTVICTLTGSGVIDYQMLMGSWTFFTHYAPSWLPDYLYGDGRIYWQTFIDIILIFVCIVLIFYHRKND